MITVETEEGVLLEVDLVQDAKYIIETLEKDGRFRVSGTVQDYVDSHNRYIRLCPESPKAVGRVDYNQCLFDLIMRIFALEFKLQKEKL